MEAAVRAGADQREGRTERSHWASNARSLLASPRRCSSKARCSAEGDKNCIPASYLSVPAGFAHRIYAAHWNGERSGSSIPSCVMKKLTVTTSPTVNGRAKRMAAPPVLRFFISAYTVWPASVSSHEIRTGKRACFRGVGR